ncbi:MAG TPA: hypothetical protein VGM86_13560 [Thermoanaerobaculia bacterium]
MVIVPRIFPSGCWRSPSFASSAACRPSGQWRFSAIRPVSSSTSSMRPSRTM